MSHVLVRLARCIDSTDDFGADRQCHLGWGWACDRLFAYTGCLWTGEFFSLEHPA